MLPVAAAPDLDSSATESHPPAAIFSPGEWQVTMDEKTKL